MGGGGDCKRPFPPRFFGAHPRRLSAQEPDFTLWCACAAARITAHQQTHATRGPRPGQLSADLLRRTRGRRAVLVAHRVQTTERTRVAGDRTRAAKKRGATSAPHINARATKPFDDPARCKALLPPHGPGQALRRCPVHRAERPLVGLDAQGKRSTSHSIERCLDRAPEQVVRASSSSQSGAAPSLDGRLRASSDPWREAGVERRARGRGWVRGSRAQMLPDPGQTAHGGARPRPNTLHLNQASGDARSGIRRTVREPHRSPPLRARSPAHWQRLAAAEVPRRLQAGPSPAVLKLPFCSIFRRAIKIC